MSDDRIDPRHPITAMIQDIVFAKAKALDRNNMAEIEFELEVESPDGMKFKESGVIRKEPSVKWSLDD